MKITLLLLLLTFGSVYSQPVINGLKTGDANYISVATWTQPNTGFGDHGMNEILAYKTNTDLYIIIVGECESNANDFFFFINGSTSGDGVTAGTQLPAGNDGLSPFSNCRPFMDFETDYGVRLTNTLDGGGTGYISIINYRSGGNTDTYLGSVNHNGTAVTVNSGTYTGVVMAYVHTPTGLSTVVDQGFEISIPLSTIGAVSTTSFELFAMYGNNDYMSANTLPEIAGQSGNNLAVNPNFSLIAGDQHSPSAQLPVELVSFTVSISGNVVKLKWRTSTEINNQAFVIDRSVNNQNWQQIGSIKGSGNSSAVKNYSFTDNKISVSGTYSYRLKQIDNDGSYKYSEVININFENPAEFSLSQNYPNPFNPNTSISFTIPEATNVRLTVYNAIGQVVKVMENGYKEAGKYSIVFNAEELTTGLYFYKIEAGAFSQMKKMMLIK